MSNIIPIVSSSPPPLDDGGGWDDDEDDDFGNFASAPSDGPSQSNENTFPVDWSNETFHSVVAPKAQLPDVETGQPTVNGFQDDSLPTKTDLSNSNSEAKDDECVHNGPNSEQDSNDNFCKPFAVSFDDEPPHIPITKEESHTDTDCGNSQSEITDLSQKLVGETQSSVEIPTTVSTNITVSMLSTASTIDSGVFSPETDLSPLSHPDSCPNKDKEENFDNIVSGAGEIDTMNSDDTVREELVGNDAESMQIVCDSNTEEDDDWSNFNEAVPSEVVETGYSIDISHVDNPQTDESVLSSVDDSGCCGTTEVTNYENEDIKNNLSGEEHKTRQRKDSIGAETENTHSKAVEHCGDKSVTVQSSSLCEEVGVDRVNLGSISTLDDLTTSGNQETDEHYDSLSLEENVSGSAVDSKSSADNESSLSQSVPCDLENSSDDTQLEVKKSFSNISGEKESINAEQEAVGGSSKEFLKDNEVAENVDGTNDTMKLTDVETVETNNNSEDDKEFGDFSSVDQDQKTSDLTFRTSLCEDDEDEIEAEKSPPFECDDNDDDFGDFDAFNSSPAAEPSEKEDFGDFDSCPTNNTKVDCAADSSCEDVEGSAVVADEDDFGDFDEAGTSDEQGAGWADFGSTSADVTQQESSTLAAHQQDAAPQTSSSVMTTLKVDQSKGKVLLAVEKCFPVVEESLPDTESHTNSSSQSEDNLQECKITALDVVVDLGLANPQEAKQQTWTVVQHPAKKDPRVLVWSHLKDVDSSSALSYTWPASHGSKEVFCTLHIDTQNILFTQKKQAVPFFASGLGILEPTRGSNTHSDGKKEKTTLPPTLLDTSANTKQVLGSDSSAPQDIPPVDFDWSVSGLTNPLTANTLDLDFLVVQGSDSCEKTADEWDWVFKSDTEDSSTSRSGLQSLEEMLKKSKPTAKLATHEVLSPEAEKVLAKMPDLTFMQSKVLMFPVKQ